MSVVCYVYMCIYVLYMCFMVCVCVSLYVCIVYVCVSVRCVYDDRDEKVVILGIMVFENLGFVANMCSFSSLPSNIQVRDQTLYESRLPFYLLA